MGTDDSAAATQAITRLANARRICAQFDPGGQGNPVEEIAEHAYAVVIAGRDTATRVVWAIDVADIAGIYAACIRGDEDYAREQVDGIYSTDTGERLHALEASARITVVAEVDDVRVIQPDDGPVARFLESAPASVSLSSRKTAPERVCDKDAVNEIHEILDDRVW